MNIGIVGAGEAGYDLLTLLKDNSDIKINCICDTNEKAEGIILAKKLGIKTFSDFNDLKNKKLDVIVEVTGSDFVRESLLNEYGKTNTAVIGAKAAKFLSLIISDAIKTNKKLDNQLNHIDKSASALKNEFDSIIQSVRMLIDVKETLNEAANKSKKFIENSSQLTGSINKIAQKNKILGLNANIEAARAGEAGKGFSIVASEIQKLSETTDNFASEISNSLEGINDEISKVNFQTENLTSVANNQSRVTEKLNTVLDNLIAEINI